MEVGEQTDAMWGLHNYHPIERSGLQVERLYKGVLVGRQLFFAHRVDRDVNNLLRVSDLHGVSTVILEMHTQFGVQLDDGGHSFGQYLSIGRHWQPRHHRNIIDG